MLETIYISFLFIFILIFIFYKKSNPNLVSVQTKNGLKFSIYKDKLQIKKTELMGDIITNMILLKEHLINNKNDFPEEDKEYIDLLKDNFDVNKTIIYETEPESDLTSYSVNKGQELSICLKSKKNNQLHDINLFMYVSIHEMAHMGCPDIGHGETFKKVFKFFIEEAIKINVYKYVNYSENPTEYCGMNLSSSII